ncbi:complex I intermediate-associated protein 30 [Megalopta genalis]|uniref:complex I intermediate-associated protein 30 n=1 Tax=Megalopta genalis TaxID=115081 RepID=UPI003FD496DC
MIRLLHLCSRISNANTRRFHNSSCVLYVWEPYKQDYPIKYDVVEKPKKLSVLGRLKAGCNALKREGSLFLKEMRDVFRVHPTMIVPEVEDVIWKFDGTKECRNQWVLSCDSDYNEGYSTAKLEFTNSGTGLFHGHISTRIPKDGKIGRAGYCNIMTVPKTKSFYRKSMYDFSCYNTLVLRVRGDGRCYMLNVLQRGHLDLTRDFCYHYLMYTSGGPYWQHVKIPFAKLVFAIKGGVQIHQKPMPTALVTNFGITLGDKIDGPFQLEIDYIAVCYDPSVLETCAYEMVDIREA